MTPAPAARSLSDNFGERLATLEGRIPGEDQCRTERMADHGKLEGRVRTLETSLPTMQADLTAIKDIVTKQADAAGKVTEARVTSKATIWGAVLTALALVVATAITAWATLANSHALATVETSVKALASH